MYFIWKGHEFKEPRAECYGLNFAFSKFIFLFGQWATLRQRSDQVGSHSNVWWMEKKGETSAWILRNTIQSIANAISLPEIKWFEFNYLLSPSTPSCVCDSPNQSQCSFMKMACCPVSVPHPQPSTHLHRLAGFTLVPWSSVLLRSALLSSVLFPL